MNEKFTSIIIIIWVYVASFVFTWPTTDSPQTSGFQGQRLLVQTKDCEIKSRITTTNYALWTYLKCNIKNSGIVFETLEQPSYIFC